MTTNVSKCWRQRVAVLAAALLWTGASVGFAQDTQPQKDPEGQAQQGLTLEFWTCPMHKQVRMLESGACPICERDLDATDVQVRGAEPLGDPYPLDVCPMSGRKLGSVGTPVVMVYEGREVRFCCAGCVESFEEEPDKYWKQIDEQIVEQQLRVYSLETCPMSGRSLTVMGEPVDAVFQNRLVRFCCNMCRKDFEEEPAANLAKFDEAVASKQKEGYPLKKCMISGMELGSMGEPIDLVFGNRLVRFCCSGCVAGFWKEPAKYYGQLREAWAEANEHDAGQTVDNNDADHRKPTTRPDHDNGDQR